MKLLINTTRDSYSLERCGRTMTVGELMCVLAQCDENAPVYFKHDGGYTCGALTEEQLEREWEEGEEE